MDFTLYRFMLRAAMVVATAAMLSGIATTAAASATRVWLLTARGGITAVPWNLVCDTIPGVLIGGQLGPMLQGRVSQRAMTRAIGALFLVIALAMGGIALSDWGVARP
ncbi:MAG: hypothetical protein R3229_09980 [Alphaproteobacteria bacterium]|nr:hypothetical protein [Alphaproteobacteria bacterium]